MGDKEKRMKNNVWDRVTITWNCSGHMGIHTSVCMDGSFNPDLHDPHVFDTSKDDKLHGLFAMESVSQPHEEGDGRRLGEMTIDVRCKGRALTPNSEAIVKFIDAELKKLKDGSPRICDHIRVTPPAQKSWTETKFKLFFILANGAHFCDSSIEIGRAVFNGLGVKDDHGYYLARFAVKRETFVMLDGGWITFPHWLRMSHRLPVFGPEDHM
jgi:hypothetical protein